jgi:hypothetical protein
MTNRSGNHQSGRKAALLLSAAAFLFLFAQQPAAAKDAAETVGGVTPKEALRLGEKMYRDGLLPSGKPMEAMVKGDIPVQGSQFTCANCHQRSGFGSEEGLVRTPAVYGSRLYSPVSAFKGIPLTRKKPGANKQQDFYRPAYTDETLAKVMLTGIDPTGRNIGDTMPRYFLNDRDMAIMVYYLKHLSSGKEPGVTDTTLRFATVITDEVPKDEREAMLHPLRLFVENFRLPLIAERMLRGGTAIREGRGRSLPNGPFSRMRSFAYREFFLELIDGMVDLSIMPVPYPRLSFGQGRRSASKGCYVIQLGEGPDPKLIDRSGWTAY